MLAGKVGLTAVIIGLEVTVFPDAHVAFDINVQVTTCPFKGG